MVSKAIDEGLIARLQNYVATDLNSKVPPSASEDLDRVRPENVYVTRFTRVLNNWEALAIAHLYPDTVYEIIHDGDTNVTLVNIYLKRKTQPAII